MIIFSIFFQLASAECTAPVKATELSVSLNEAEEAFKKMNSKLFRTKIEEVNNRIPCLSEVLPSSDVTTLYRVFMVDAFTRRDMTAFGGYARALDDAYPEISLLDGLVQDGHPMKNFADFAVSQQKVTKKTLPSALNTNIYVDGKRELVVPLDRPYLFQEVSKKGLAISTKIILDANVPEYPVSMRERYWNIKLQPRMVIAAGALAGLSLSSGTLAYYKEQEFWNSSTANSDLDSLQRQTNLWTASSIILGLTGTGVLVYAGVEGAK
tara:strand:- start:196 stop:996 length:801 start_codon:yes stop_codon:yes gene_type:complete